MAKKKPMPGDLLCAIKSDDVLIKKGSCGIIEGRAGVPKKRYQVTYNPSPLPWWEKGVISSSGGPTKLIDTKRMKSTSRKRKQKFQYFPFSPGPGEARTKEKKVNVFEIDLTKRGKKR